MCIEPLNSDNNQRALPTMNIMTGIIAPYTVNATIYVATGKEPIKQFKTSWPESFSEPSSNKVAATSLSALSISN